MKSYTDLEQSKKLAEILPLESADMTLPFRHPKNDEYIPEYVVSRNYVEVYNEIIKLPAMEKEDVCKLIQPSWSLAALLAILPNEIITDNRFECHYQIDIRKYDGGDNTTLYQIAYGNNRGSSGSWHDMINTGEKENLVDCCVQMILKLHEFKML